MADAVTDWRGLRLLVLVLAALVLTVAAFGAWCLVQVVDARTQERLVAQQNTEADPVSYTHLTLPTNREV